MFWRKKNRPWYLKTVGILIVLRIIYGFASFFMKAVHKQARASKRKKDRMSI